MIEEPAGRRPPARRDPQGALPQERHPRPRRAHRRAHPARDRGAVRRSSRSLAETGTTVIFITHKLNEVLEVADHITVLRRGRVAGTADPKTTTRQELANLMVGRDVELIVTKGPGKAGRRRPELQDLSSATTASTWPSTASTSTSGGRDRRHRRASRATARPSSSRRSSACARSTRATIDDRRARTSRSPSPREVSDLGVAHIPEDRQRDGLIVDFSVAENYILDTYHRAPYSKADRPASKAINERAAEGVEGLRHPDAVDRHPGRSLSGGNQQKVVVAREFSAPVQLVIAAPAHARPRRRLDRVHPPTGSSSSATPAPPS